MAHFGAVISENMPIEDKIRILGGMIEKKKGIHPRCSENRSYEKGYIQITFHEIWHELVRKSRETNKGYAS
jgi:hypothetical protein